MDSKIIHVAYADDHTAMRKGVIAMIASDEIKIIIEAENGIDMLQKLKTAPVFPDICIVDMGMPVMDGFALVPELKQAYPELKILIFTGYTHPVNVIKMINAGVNGYLSKDCSPKEIKRALNDIQEKGYYYSDLADETFFIKARNADIKATNIPEREMQFLKHCCSDLRYDQIAKKMGISTSTLDGCRERLFNRLGVESRMALIVFALQTGIVASDPYTPPNYRLKF